MDWFKLCDGEVGISEAQRVEEFGINVELLLFKTAKASSDDALREAEATKRRDN